MVLVRKGECKRCGDCCTIAIDFTKEPPEILENTPCPYFSRDEDGLGVCNIQGGKPEACKLFPHKPPDPKYYKNCGYYFEEE